MAPSLSPQEVGKLFHILNAINNNLVSASGNQTETLERLTEKIELMGPGTVKPEAVIKGLLAKVQKDFEEALEAKTGWGRRELAQVMANVVSNTDKWAMKHFTNEKEK